MPLSFRFFVANFAVRESDVLNLRQVRLLCKLFLDCLYNRDFFVTLEDLLFLVVENLLLLVNC